MDTDKPKSTASSVRRSRQRCRRNNRLTATRKQLVVEFNKIHRNSPVGSTGGEVWKMNLCYYMRSKGQSVRLEDIDHWVANNKWILDDNKPKPSLFWSFPATPSCSISKADSSASQKQSDGVPSERNLETVNDDAVGPTGEDEGSALINGTLHKP